MSQGNADMPNSSNATNGISKRTKKKRSDENSQGTLSFGKLTEDLKSEIEAFRPAQNALLNISNIFQEYGAEIEVVDKNYGTMQAKDEKIRDLNSAMRLWKSTRDEEVENLRREIGSMAEERGSLEVEKQKFEKVRDEKAQELQRSQVQLVEKEHRLKEGYEKKLKQARNELKEETRERLTQLEGANGRMTQEITALQVKLATAAETISNERRDWSIVRNTLNEQNRKLELELESVKKDFAVEARSDDFYKQKFLDIQENVIETSYKFFSTFPQSQGPKKTTREGRDISSDIAEFALLSESAISTSLRLSAVESIIVDSVRKLVWQPFAAGGSRGDVASGALLQTVSRELSRLGSRTESTWRALTVRGLRAPPAESGLLKSVIGDMLGLLTPFTDAHNSSELAESLTEIVHKAVDVWDISQRDACQLLIQNAPDADDESGWLREDGGLSSHPHDRIDADVSASRSMSAVCIFPKVIRLPSSGKSPQRTIFRGRALFEDSRLLASGRKESMDLQKMMMDAHKQFATQKGGESGLLPRSDRRSSIAAQMTLPNMPSSIRS